MDCYPQHHWTSWPFMIMLISSTCSFSVLSAALTCFFPKNLARNLAPARSSLLVYAGLNYSWIKDYINIWNFFGNNFRNKFFLHHV